MVSTWLAASSPLLAGEQVALRIRLAQLGKAIVVPASRQRRDRPARVSKGRFATGLRDDGASPLWVAAVPPCLKVYRWLA
jgi:hypothetical protein